MAEASVYIGTDPLNPWDKKVGIEFDTGDGDPWDVAMPPAAARELGKGLIEAADAAEQGSAAEVN